MKQKHIDACREARLWLSQIILPLVVGGGWLISKQEVRDWIDSKIKPDTK